MGFFVTRDSPGAAAVRVAITTARYPDHTYAFQRAAQTINNDHQSVNNKDRVFILIFKRSFYSYQSTHGDYILLQVLL